MFSDNYKRVLVSGMARSGIAAARLLKDHGCDVTCQDLKPADKIDNASALEADGITLYLGKNPDDIIADFDLVVLSPGISTDLPFVEKAKDLGVPVWGEMELAYRFCPCPITAVTGTNGKTTTTALIGEIMEAHNHDTAVVGNIGTPFAERVGRVTADSWVVAEISSFQLETIQTFRPKISAVLNVTPDHLDRHKTMERYALIKESVGKYQMPGDFIILNYDDLLCRKMRSRARHVFFSRCEPLYEGFFLKAGNLHARFNGREFDIVNANRMNIIGNHNIENALAASAAAICAGVPVETLRAALERFKAVEHRIEFVRELNGVRYYNDSKGTNIDSAVKALEAMKWPVVLIGGGYDKRADFSEWVTAFKDRVKELIVLGETADQIAETCHAYGFENIQRVNTLKDAVYAASGAARRGDCVLLSPACASWDMFDNYEQRGNMFKDYVFKL
ncbi:MAG: UDP-N-acetylmuramoyl-L-alanine--D-glutamate ligase [Clostridiales bacterium]|nr:UDP-N-acetylmuramoyl-L-alanine--D-glutamate ligase [Clostridiales bacterium]